MRYEHPPVKCRECGAVVGHTTVIVLESVFEDAGPSPYEGRAAFRCKVCGTITEAEPRTVRLELRTGEGECAACGRPFPASKLRKVLLWQSRRVAGARTSPGEGWLCSECYTPSPVQEIDLSDHFPEVTGAKLRALLSYLGLSAIVCPHCGGAGEVPGGEGPCLDCHGSGWIVLPSDCVHPVATRTEGGGDGD